MAPSRRVGIIITFASKPSSVIVATHIEDYESFARHIMVIDIRNGTCLIKSSFITNNDIECDFDEINNQLTISNYVNGNEGASGFPLGIKAIVIPLYSKDLP